MTLRFTSPHAPSVVRSVCVDAGDGLLEVALEDAVQLDALPAGEAQRAVGVLAGEVVHAEVLLGGEPAAGDLAADHEDVVLAQPLAAPGLAGVAVLLLVAAVELDQVLVRVVELVGAGGQFLGDRAAQPAAVFLDQFDRRPLRLARGGFVRRHQSILVAPAREETVRGLSPSILAKGSD